MRWNHTASLPACRAVVHHGGAGTTAAGMRAGIPTLILWMWIDHPISAEVVTRLGVGSWLRFRKPPRKHWSRDSALHRHPQCVTRAREVATRMTKPAESAKPAPPISWKTPFASVGALADRRRRTAWAPVTKLNRMPLDSQAHRMPQGPLSGPSTIERQGQKGTSGSRAVPFLLGRAHHRELGCVDEVCGGRLWEARGRRQSPPLAVGRELLRRGHEVCMAVPPNLLSLVESVDQLGGRVRADLQAVEGFLSRLLEDRESDHQSARSHRAHYPGLGGEGQMTLTELAAGADLVVAGITEQGLAANVAEFHGILLAALHMVLMRILQLGWLDWRITQEAENTHRRALGLPRQPGPRRCNVDRWRSRPTMSSACPARQLNGWNQVADGPSSGRRRSSADSRRRRLVVDRRGTAADLLRLWQHEGHNAD